MMRFSSFAVFLGLSVLAVASPLRSIGQRRSEHSLFAAEELIDYVASVTDDTSNQCDLSQAQQPAAPTPLPPVSPGLKLSHIAIGRGTQNYTCATSDASSVPAAIGAYADLFDVSCLTVDCPLLVSQLPQIALDLPVSFTQAVDSAAEHVYGYLGRHFFVDLTTPFFDLDTPTHDDGTGEFKKVAASAAPAGAIRGPNGNGNGAVAWLKLAANPATKSTQTLQEVYRLNTAGGAAPATCEGQPAKLFVPYSAEYWFYT